MGGEETAMETAAVTPRTEGVVEGGPWKLRGGLLPPSKLTPGPLGRECAIWCISPEA